MKMSFEVRERDLLARIGRLKTKSGGIETPLLLPVVNPAIQLIPPRFMREKLGCKALMTNAYIIKKHFGEEAIQKGIHKLLDFNGIIMTDSGAYQILVYGDVDVTHEEIVEYQEKIDTDIAIVLDVPTGWGVSRKRAEETVEETLARARRLVVLKKRRDIAWVGPIQGGQYLDLIAHSAREISKLPFEIHALGSPTPVMERYLFDVLVDMIMTAKMNIPQNRPLHLFGAGHPMMFSLAVALGCDLFDSAAYAIYAREDRYMTERGTVKLSKLEYLPCSCPACVGRSVDEIKEMPSVERRRVLAEHNLYLSFSEIKRVKQAIVEGRLWEYLEMKAHSHPTLLQALKKLKKYSEYLERNSPVTKESGLLFLSSLGLTRPEVIRHRKRLIERYQPPKNSEVLILLPQTKIKPFHKSRECKYILRELRQNLKEKLDKIHICFYVAPFGVVPIELDEVYPLSQHETAMPLDIEVISYVARQVAEYISSTDYRMVILVQDENWNEKVTFTCRDICNKKNIAFHAVKVLKSWRDAAKIVVERCLNHFHGEKND